MLDTGSCFGVVVMVHSPSTAKTDRDLFLLGNNAMDIESALGPAFWACSLVS